MFNIIKWLNKGGGKVIGYDDDGVEKYSMANGEMIMFSMPPIIGAIVLIAIILVVKGVLK